MEIQRRRFKISLREHIAAATAGITILLSLGISYLAASISMNQIEQREGAAFASHANDTAEMMDRGMFERYREMQVASVLSDISDPNVSIDAKRKVLEQMKDSFNAYAWVGICDTHGRGMVGTGKYLEGKDLSKRPWCIQGRNKPYVGDVHDALLLAKLLPNPAGGGFYLLDVAAPIHKPDGSLLGVLCGHIYWKWAEEMLNVSRRASTDTILVSKDGQVLAGPLAARSKLASVAPQTMAAAMRKPSGFLLEKWSDGKTYLTGFARGSGYRDYPGLGWISLYRQNVDIAFAPARELQKKILFDGFLLGLVFVIVGWWQAGRIASPIQAITNAAKQVAKGNLAYKAPDIHSDKEVEELADSIQRMAETMTSEIQDRKSAENHLRKISEAIHQAGEAVIITDRQGVIEYINPSCSEITGYAPDELIGKTPAILKSDKQDPKFYAHLWQTITRGEVWHGTLIDKRKDGLLYPALMSVAPIRDDSGEITHFVSIQQDMTEQKKLEDQFMQSQKMEALGTLVGGIAHDFNNMLVGITGNLFLAESELDEPEKVRERLQQIDMLSMRAEDMIRQMMAFARKGSISKVAINLPKKLREIVKLAKATVPESTRLILHLDEKDMQVEADATQMHQILLNLITNAQHALGESSNPQIEIGLNRFEPDPSFRSAHPELTAKHFAHLFVRDNGHGISEADLPHVTEPFFTTKDVGKGTGLGLPMVFGAVQGHGGALEIESKVGTGTTIHIYLPILTENESSLTEQGEKDKIVRGNGECILLVDDDKTVLDVTREALKSLGYCIEVASNGREAVHIYSERANDFSLVLMDVVMPEMGGIKASERILQINPLAKVVFMCGYDREELTENSTLKHHEMIAKPIQIEQLSVILSRLIQQP